MSKQQVIENLQKKSAQILAMIEKVNLLPDNLPSEAELDAEANYLYIKLPFNPKLFRQTRRALGKNWKLSHSFDAEDGRKFIVYFDKDRTDLTIVLKPNLEGSVCKLEQIDTKTIPVYKVVCHA